MVNFCKTDSFDFDSNCVETRFGEYCHHKLSLPIYKCGIFFHFQNFLQRSFIVSSIQILHFVKFIPEYFMLLRVELLISFWGCLLLLHRNIIQLILYIALVSYGLTEVYFSIFSEFLRIFYIQDWCHLWIKPVLFFNCNLDVLYFFFVLNCRGYSSVCLVPDGNGKAYFTIKCDASCRCFIGVLSG